MAKATKPKKNSDENEAESRRFIETAKALEDAGELSPTEGEAALDKLVRKSVARRPGR